MPKSNPLISVVVPMYNSAKYLPRCLDSIVNQTYRNLEIILVDDGSIDYSYPIAKSYVAKDSRVKLIHQINSGLSSARNTGIAQATGAYITFVDSDDEISHDMIKKLLTALQNTSADISACSFKEIYPSGRVTHFSHDYPAKTYNTEQALSAMLMEHGFMVSATMKLFPTKYFKHIEFPVGKLHEDIGTTYKLIMQATTISFIPDELYFYHHHRHSIISTKSFSPRKLDIITLTDQMCDDIDAKYPALLDITRERRMRARFSVLRQIPLSHPKTRQILKYLKTHQTFITENPKATRTDRLALKLALSSPRLFRLAYRLKKS